MVPGVRVTVGPRAASAEDPRYFLQLVGGNGSPNEKGPRRGQGSKGGQGSSEIGGIPHGGRFYGSISRLP